MAILFQNSGKSRMLSIKILLISSCVLSTAVMLKLSLPGIIEFAVSELPSIWSFLLSWLRPPYLYLVINCIIITILASSRLQSKLVVDSPAVKVSAARLLKTADYAAAYGYGGFVLQNNETVEFVESFHHDSKVVKPSEFDAYSYNSHVELEAAARASETPAVVKSADVPEHFGRDEFVMSKPSWKSPNKDLADYFSSSDERPSVSARFGHRKTVKASPEVGKNLRVAKWKKQETLESPWKAITEGHPTPLTRHLRKSDTWETRRRHRHHHDVGSGAVDQQEKMIKLETFSERRSINKSSPLSPSPGSGKLRKEPSLSQDELNRRVEAFINKFNEDMRLQRQESLNRYMEMINRGAH